MCYNIGREKGDNMDRAKAKQIRKKLEAHLKTIEKDLGVCFSIGNISFSDALATIKVVAAEEVDGVVETKASLAFKRYCYCWDMRKEDLGKTFTFGSDEFRVSGGRPRARKFPIIATNTKTGKGTCFPASTVKTLLEHASA